MKSIVVTNFKGGTGKTFVSVVLAELFMMAEKSVAVVDLDAQLNAVEYLRRGDGQRLFKNIVPIPAYDKTPDFATLGAYDVVIVDTPPRSFTDAAIRRVLGAADLVIIPLVLHRHALTAYRDLTAAENDIIPRTVPILPVCSVPSQIPKWRREYLDALLTPESSGGRALPLVQLPVFNRVDDNLGQKREFWYRLKESEFKPFSALYDAAAGALGL